MSHRDLTLFRCAVAVMAGFSLIVAISLQACSFGAPPPPAMEAGAREGGEGGDAGTNGLNCSALIKCDQPCGNNRTCTSACFARSTAIAQGYFDEFTSCLNVACSSGPGGPCAQPLSSTCASCNSTAATDTCVDKLVNCENDTAVGPPNGDGGVIFPDAGKTNGLLACGALLACEAACPTDGGMGAYDQCIAACKFSATPTAIKDYASLQKCFSTACPSTDGGPCEHPGTKCSGCQEVAVFAMPNTCAAPFETCEHDTSNGTGADSVPTAHGGKLWTVVTGLVQPASTLVVADGYLYFAQVIQDSKVHRVKVGDGKSFPKGGTDVNDAETIGPPFSTPIALAVDSKNVYVWASGTYPGTTSFNNDNGTVTQVPLDGSPAITLRKGMEVLYDADYLNGVAVDSSSVYWVEGAKGKDGVIMKTPIGKAEATPIFKDQDIPQAIATDGTNVYWVDWGTFDKEGASNNDGTVWQGSVNGGTPKLLASNQPAPGTIAIDANNVYWTNLGKLGADLFPATNSGSVVQVPIGGGKVTTLASSQPIPVSVGVANGNVYATLYGLSVPGVISSEPIGGGKVTNIATGLNDCFELTTAGTTVYWSNTPSSNGMGTILAFTPQ
jgi:hypothetical protein